MLQRSGVGLHTPQYSATYDLKSGASPTAGVSEARIMQIVHVPAGLPGVLGLLSPSPPSHRLLVRGRTAFQSGNFCK